MDIIDRKKRFLLLQINDALFPIGGYSHSYGLETYIQKNLVTNTEEAWKFLKNRLCYGFCYNEFLTARLAYRYASDGDLEELIRLEELLEALRVPREIREAGKKLGSRFVKTLQKLEIPYESDIFERYTQARQGQTMVHACAYGVFCAATGIDYEDAMEQYLYAQTSSMVTNCVKTIPLSQTDGQILLYRSETLFHEILECLETLTEEDLCMSTPGFDIRCMQHEGLYSRLFMS
jgi:urease accessory protein